jgi:hypothetical protein
MALVKSTTGTYALGFVLMAIVALTALVVLRAEGRARSPSLGPAAGSP